MARKGKKAVRQCEFFLWGMFQRDGVWYADGRLAGQNLGKHSLGTRDRDEADTNLKFLDRQKGIERGLVKPEAVPPNTSSDVPIADGWRRYLDYQARSEVSGGCPSVAERYRSVSVRHGDYCKSRGVAGWQQVDRRHIEKYGDFVHAMNFAENTQHLELTALKAVKNFLVEEGLLPESARVRISLRRSQETTTYCFKRGEVHAMLRFCESRPGLPWLGDILLALSCTGTRVGELLRLRWSDIENDTEGLPQFLRIADERGNARVQKMGTGRRTKGRRSRMIPIHRALRARLLQLPRAADGRIFHRDDGAVLKYHLVHHAFTKSVRNHLQAQFPTVDGELGFGDACFHSFRHYFVSQAFIGGATEGAIREWVGHRDSRIVERYRHLAEDDSRRKMESLNLVSDVPGTGSSGPDSRARKGRTRKVSTANKRKSSETVVT